MMTTIKGTKGFVYYVPRKCVEGKGAYDKRATGEMDEGIEYRNVHDAKVESRCTQNSKEGPATGG